MKKMHIAIACGGTGGHIFPGLAIADRLYKRDCEVTIIISNKEVDRRAVEGIQGVTVLQLPAIAPGANRWAEFSKSFVRSFNECRRFFSLHKPDVIFSTGGFVSAGPVLAGKLFGATIFLHESNAIPGRANKLMSRLADRVFVGFECAGNSFNPSKVVYTGTPVRPWFYPRDKFECRRKLGLDEHRQTLLIAGGSQGAHGINALMHRSMELIKERLGEWQFLHVTGVQDSKLLQEAYNKYNLKAKVWDFSEEVELLLGASTVAVSRAGGSFLAELALMKVPSVLIPYPYAADNHQLYNALYYVKSGVARMLEESKATPELLVGMITQMSEDSPFRANMMRSFESLNHSNATDIICEFILKSADSFEEKNAAEVEGLSIWRAGSKKLPVNETEPKKHTEPEHTEPVLVK